MLNAKNAAYAACCLFLFFCSKGHAQATYSGICGASKLSSINLLGYNDKTSDEKADIETLCQVVVKFTPQPETIEGQFLIYSSINGLDSVVEFTLARAEKVAKKEFYKLFARTLITKAASPVAYIAKPSDQMLRILDKLVSSAKLIYLDSDQFKEACRDIARLTNVGQLADHKTCKPVASWWFDLAYTDVKAAIYMASGNVSKAAYVVVSGSGKVLEDMYSNVYQSWRTYLSDRQRAEESIARAEAWSFSSRQMRNDGGSGFLETDFNRFSDTASEHVKIYFKNVCSDHVEGKISANSEEIMNYIDDQCKDLANDNMGFLYFQRFENMTRMIFDDSVNRYLNNNFSGSVFVSEPDGAAYTGGESAKWSSYIQQVRNSNPSSAHQRLLLARNSVISQWVPYYSRAFGNRFYERHIISLYIDRAPVRLKSVDATQSNILGWIDGKLSSFASRATGFSYKAGNISTCTLETDNTLLLKNALSCFSDALDSVGSFRKVNDVLRGRDAYLTRMSARGASVNLTQNQILTVDETFSYLYEGLNGNTKVTGLDLMRMMVASARYMTGRSR